jgi:hypothetical protein
MNAQTKKQIAHTLALRVYGSKRAKLTQVTETALSAGKKIIHPFDRAKIAKAERATARAAKHVIGTK